jgi:uncharacterized Ntn-hydrolase superfamily protein
MTYSIVARDEASQEMGVATHSQAFAVGSSVPWAEPGVGVIATQSVAEPFYGELGLDLLRGGLTATEALRALRSIDPHPERRQLAMFDSTGDFSVYTGDGCVPAAGHAVGRHCAALANMAARESVWPAMVGAYEEADGSLANRMLAALDAAEAEGGDARGQRSAAILVVRAVRTGRPWRDHIVDLRVDEHDRPVEEIRRLVEFSDTYHTVVRGFERSIDGDQAAALEIFRSVHDRVDSEPDYLMYLGLAQVAAGRVEEAAASFGALRRCSPAFLDVVATFPDAGLLPEHREPLEQALGRARSASGA